MTDADKHYKRIPLVVFIFLSLLFLTGSGCIPVTEESAIDAKTVTDIIEKAKPLIEDITGRKFKSDIDFRIVNRYEFQEILKKDLLKGIREWQKDPGEDIVKRRMEVSAGIRSQFYIGRYFKREPMLYIIQNNIKPIKDLYEINDEDLNDFLFIVIAHEMVHALDNQYYDLLKLLSESKDEENNYARGAVIGGSAAYVTEILADRLNIPDEIYKTSLMIDVCMKDESDLRSKEVYELYYVKAKEFFRTLIAERGMEEYGSVFTSPPASTRQIYHPEEYFGAAYSLNVDCMELLSRIIPALPEKENMRLQTTALGSVTLRGTLMNEGIKEKDASLIADKCRTGASCTLVQPGISPVIISVDLFNFDDMGAAVKYDEISRLIQNSKDNQFRARLNTSIEILKEQQKELEGFDFLWFRNIRFEEDGRINSRKSATGIMKNMYISIKYLNMAESTEKEIMDIMKLIYSEYSTMKQKRA